MKKTSMAIIAFSATTLVLYSCSKNYDRNPSGTTPIDGATEIGQVLSSISSPRQTFLVTAGSSIKITGSQGTVLNFYPNSFKDVNGNIITSGTVSLQLTEMYSAADMFANNTSCIAAGELLQSGGQIKIAASMNGKTVYANKYGIAFKQTAASTQPMNLFYGVPEQVNGSLVWRDGADTTKPGSTASGTTTDSSRNIYYLFDSCTEFNFINCDYFMRGSGTGVSVPVSVVISDTSFTPGNTKLYMTFPGIKAAISCSSGLTKYWSYDTSYRSQNVMYLPYGMRQSYFPKNLNYKFVAVANKNNKYYYYETSGTVSDSTRLQVAFTAKSRDEVKVLLKAL